MSSDKKDLTRIEDLGEFLHELNSDDENSEDFTDELPDLPALNDESSLDFSSEEDSTTLESDDLETSDFSPNDETFTSDFESETVDTFENPEFSATEEQYSEETKISEESNNGPLENMTTWDADVPLTEELTPPQPQTPSYTASKDFKTPETFEDLKKFSESSSFTGMASEGNPSFSVLVKNVRYIEDVNDIITLLRELGLMVDSEEQIKARLMRGDLLVPRISEFAAIFLAHKLRRFDIDIQLGLSDEIHPPRHGDSPETGIVSKHNLYQNQQHHFQFDNTKLDISQIIVSATSGLEGYQVIKYIGVASEHKILEGHLVEDENSSEVPLHYHELAQRLRAHAIKVQSNAVVGLNYQLTPLPTEFGLSGHKYRLTCTGNLVWVNKL